LIFSAVRGFEALVSTLIVLIYSLLMLKEFFVKDWLKRHFLIYAFSHMLIMPLFAMVVYSFSTGNFLWQAPGWFWFYAFVGFFVTLNWEISRKIRAPDQELSGVDSYSKIFGTYGAGYAVLFIRFIDTMMVMMVGYHLGLSTWFYIVLVILYFVCVRGFYQFRVDTNARNAKRLETYAGMYIIAFDLILAVEIVRKVGVEWTIF